jgi:hypothetical protein
MSTNIADLPYTAPAPSTTQLPERDIPRETLPHVVDPQTTVNYVPKAPEYMPPPPQPPAPSLMVKYVEEFRVPIVLSLLYYIFQMGFVQDALHKFVPSIFKPDGNLSSTGMIVKSGLFGVAFYGLTVLMERVSQP